VGFLETQSIKNVDKMNELYIEAIKPGNVIELYYYSHVRSYVLN